LRSNTSQVCARYIPVRTSLSIGSSILWRFLSTGEQRALKHDVPASATAYEWYLAPIRREAAGVANMIKARDLYLRCEISTNYAPAWHGSDEPTGFLKVRSRRRQRELRRADEAFKRRLHRRSWPWRIISTPCWKAIWGGRWIRWSVFKRARTHRNDPNLFAGTRAGLPLLRSAPGFCRSTRAARTRSPGSTSVAWTNCLGDFQAVLDPPAWDGLVWYLR
jgi:hypothetical protein